MHDIKAYRGRTISLIIAFFILFAFYTPVHAAGLRQLSLNGRSLNAEYQPGDTRRPAILVLHGFLQTREFLTTQAIISGLSSVGNAILSPNLSLGVPDRRQSMQCQAPHQNTFEGDLREIHAWVQWLRKQGYPSVIIVGHSWGSQHALGYANAYPATPIVALIGVSLVRAEQTAVTIEQQTTLAKTRMAQHDTMLKPYALSFCKTYMAKPETYLSYARWGDTQVLDALSRLKKRRLPVYVVIGDQDNRSDPAWVKALRERTTQLAVIHGANHFFSSLHEFELNEHLEAILGQLNATVKP